MKHEDLEESLFIEKKYYANSWGIGFYVCLIGFCVLSIAFSLYIFFRGKETLKLDNFIDFPRVPEIDFFYILALLIGLFYVLILLLNFKLLFSFWYTKKPILVISKSKINYKLASPDIIDIKDITSINTIYSSTFFGSRIIIKINKDLVYKYQTAFNLLDFSRIKWSNKIYWFVPGIECNSSDFAEYLESLKNKIN